MSNEVKQFQIPQSLIENGSPEMQSILLMMGAMKEQLDGMERFVRRRFDEISMEINATSQQLDMAEEGLGSRFSEILNSLSAISFQGAGLRLPIPE